MSTITKQWLQQKIAEMEAARDEIPFGLDEDDMNTLAALRIALASLEAEPVAYVDPFAFNNFSVYRAGDTDNKRMGREWMWANPDAGLIPVYTAQPAPVSVPNGIDKWQAIDDIRDHDESFRWDSADGYEAGWNACRAAMLQGADGALTNEDTKRVGELVMWVKRLAHSLRKANPDSKLQSDAMDYLSRKGLIGVEDILR